MAVSPVWRVTSGMVERSERVPLMDVVRNSLLECLFCSWKVRPAVPQLQCCRKKSWGTDRKRGYRTVSRRDKPPHQNNEKTLHIKCICNQNLVLLFFSPVGSRVLQQYLLDSDSNHLLQGVKMCFGHHNLAFLGLLCCQNVRWYLSLFDYFNLTLM